MTLLVSSFDTTLCRRVLALSGMNALTDYVIMERAVSPYAQWTQVRGWSSQNVSGAAVTFYDYEFPVSVPYKYRAREYDAAGVQLAATEFSVVALVLDDVWLKVPAAPFLNRPVQVSVRTEITRRSRSGVFDIVDRTLPVVVGNKRSGREFTLQIKTETGAEERDLDYLFADGQILFLHTPVEMDQFPSGYYTAGDVSRAPEQDYTARRIWEVPLIEAAMPGDDVIGSAYTIASMLADYATIFDVMADNATNGVLLQRVGSPEDVIVP
jgi:hypothetical protein